MAKHHGHHESKHESKHEEKHGGHKASMMLAPVSKRSEEIERSAYRGHIKKARKLEREDKKDRSKSEKRREKRESKKPKIGDKSKFKLKSGHKYTRIQRFPTLSEQQKKVLGRLGAKTKRARFKEPKMMQEGLEFLRRAVKKGPPESEIEKPTIDFLKKGMKEGPPTSPVETAGGSFLQRLLNEPAEEQLRGFEAPYMRQFQEEIAPAIAERYAGQNAIRGSGFQNAMMGAGAGLAENLASLKGNLINQLIGQQLQGANVGLGYAQMPGQRYGLQQQNASLGLGYAQLPASRWQQQMQASQIGIPASLIPQQTQQEMDRWAENADFQKQQQILGTQPWGQVAVPPRGRSPSFLQRAIPALGGALLGGLAGAPLGPWGIAAGALGGGLSGASGHVPSVNVQVPQAIGASPMRQIGTPINNLGGPV